MYRTRDIFGNGQNVPVPRDQQWNVYNSRNHNPHGGFFRHQSFKQSYYDGPSGNAFNNEYWCETCDRGFRTEVILENHKKQHQKCNIDGCQFIAHPKVITKHIQMQHSTGLYKKIAKLNNPEEIEKWREERRKKYPTKCNIEKKNSERQEKLERGEKMGMGSLKRNRETITKKNGVKDSSRKEHKMLKRNLPKKSEKQRKSNKIVKFQTETAERRYLKPFAGIQQLMEDTNDKDGDSSPEMTRDLIEDFEELVEDVINQETLEAKPVVCGALVSLINDYGLTDEEEEEVTKESCIELSNISSTHNNVVKQEIHNENTSAINKDTEGDDSGPEEIKVVKVIEKNNIEDDISEIKHKRNSKQHKNEKPHNKKSKVVSFKRKLPSTLLEKLLSNEIRKERNIVLQCIRHVIRNNFFDESN